MQRKTLLWLVCLATCAMGQDRANQLNVALLNPVTTLNPYYNDGVETESIINILFDSIYVQGASGSRPSFAKLADSASPNSLKRNLEVVDPFVRWMPEYREFVAPKDIQFTFHFLNMNKGSNNTYSDNYIRGFSILDDRKFEVLLRTPPDNKTLKQQLDFKVLPSRSAREHLVLFDTGTRRFVDSSNSKEAVALLKAPTTYLKVRDLIAPYGQNQYFKQTEPGIYRILLERGKVRRYKNTIFKNLNLADVAYSFYVYKHLFPDQGYKFGIADIEPINDGLAASVVLEPNTPISNPGVAKLLTMPLLFRGLDPSMKNANKYWGAPQSSYKFSIQEKANDLIALKREKSRVSGKDRSQFSVQTVHFTRQAGNDVASIRSGFQSGAIDMILNISPSLSKHITNEAVDKYNTKGSQVEMIALNCSQKIGRKKNPLADPRVRLALNYAIVKEDLHIGHAPENSEIMHGPLTSADTRSDMEPMIMSNKQEEAAKLLTEAGYTKSEGYWKDKKGKVLELKLIFEKVLDSRDRNLLVEVVNQFDAFGIKVTDPKDSSLGRVDFYKELKHNKTWHLALVRVFQSSNTDIDMYNPDSPSKNIFSYRPSPENFARMKNLFNTYRTSRDDQRRKIKQQLATMIRDESPAIFLWDFQAIFLVNGNTVIILNNNSPSTFNVLQFIDDYSLTK